MKKKKFVLREIKLNDSKVLLNWRNDELTRNNSKNSDYVEINEHEKFIKEILTCQTRTQYILEYNNIPVGTIREDCMDENNFELSYTINPDYRGKKIGQVLMQIYLIDRKGQFFCDVKNSNIPSIKMIEKLGFKLFNQTKNVNTYKLSK